MRGACTPLNLEVLYKGEIMGKKLTLEYVKSEIEKYGYRCLSNIYIDAHTKLKIQCNEEHVYEASWRRFQQNIRCPICVNNNKKKTIEEIKIYVESFGYRCLSKEYIGAFHKLKLECNKGHIYEVTWSSFQQGSRCPICAGLKKKTIEEIKIFIDSFGYRCLSKEYINCKTKLKLECNKGHQYKGSWTHFRRGERCPVCAANNQTKTIEEIKRYIESFGYKCLSKEYTNNYTKLELECCEGHQYKAIWAVFQQGNRCPYCAGKNKTIEEIKLYIESFNYKCLSEEYINSKTKLELQCDKGHQYEATWNNFRQGVRCPYCALENKSGENHPNWKNYTEEDRKNIDSYKREITQLSNINYKRYKYIINPNKLKRGRNQYHVDHIYSVIDGFNNSVSPEIIASPVNLRMLGENENIVKNGNSHMTLEQLYNLHEQFMREIN